MAVLKCKMCGGDLVFETGATVCECEYCGSKQTIPNADNEKKITLFARANRLLRSCEFDKAEGIFSSIAAEFPEEAEAYWGLVLCKYGIEYVDDPATGKKVPTCHRSSFDSVMDDADFDQVMENADTVARAVYREQAKQIEELRKGIIEVSGKEEPYDIFICYKETAEDGQRTIDSVLAQDVYDALTARGYRVFFSRISLEDKLGTEYEPYIFAALNSAKVMLAFGTTYDYYNAVWVKNEWSRFLKLMTADKSKYLIPCYKDIDAYDIPKEFAKLQAQDLGKVGAVQDLLRGIEKLIGRKQILAGVSADTATEAVKQLQAILESGVGSNTNLVALLKRGRDALEDKEFKKASEFFDQALNIDAENAQAFYGLYMAEHGLENDVAFSKSFEKNKVDLNDRNLKRAMKNASDELKDFFERLNKEKEAREAVVFKELSIKIDEQRRRNREIIPKLLDISNRLNKLSAEIDQTTLNGKFQLTEEEVKEKKKLTEETEALEKAAEAAEQEYINHPNQVKKKQLQNEIEDINATLPNLGFFQGKKKKSLEARLPEIEREINELGGPLTLLKKEVVAKRRNAKLSRDQLQSFDEVKLNQRIVTLNDEKRQLLSEIEKSGENCIIGFGTYPYKANGEKTPIEWIVINIDQGTCSMISRYCLAILPYNEYNSPSDWETSSIRKWLNKVFLKDAFSDQESKALFSVKCQYSSHAEDKVYLMSKEQASRDFRDAQLRKTQCTPYALRVGEDITTKKYPNNWWLGSTNRYRKIESVDFMGYDISVTKDFNKPMGVRPMITVDLKRLLEMC